MKKAILLCALLTAASAFGAEKKTIAVVDVGEVVRKSETGKAAVATLEKKSKSYQESFKAKEKELEKIKQAALMKATKLNPTQRAEKEKEFAAKVNSYQQYLKNAQKDMLAQEGKLTEKIVADVEALARDYGKKNGYALVVKKDGLIMSEEGYEKKDITEEIMKALDKK